MSAAPPIQLLPGERVLQHVEFSPRLILRHLKVTMILSNQRLYVTEPHTLFMFIPHGYYTHTAPLECISDVQAGNQLNSKRATFGGFMCLLAFMSLFVGMGEISVLIFLLFAAIGAVLMLTARRMAVVARTYGGGVLGAPAGSGDTAIMEMMQAAIFTESARARDHGVGASSDQLPRAQSSPVVPRQPVRPGNVAQPAPPVPRY